MQTEVARFEMRSDGVPITGSWNHRPKVLYCWGGSSKYYAFPNMLLVIALGLKPVNIRFAFKPLRPG